MLFAFRPPLGKVRGKGPSMRFHRVIVGIAFLVFRSAIAAAPATAEDILDEASPPGTNFERAEFRLWLPAEAALVRGVLVLVPGSNDDGRAMVDDPVWRAFAVRQRLAVVACHFADRHHDQDFIEDYVYAAHGSGQALLDALTRLSRRAQHPELADAPLLLWGMSAGGEFNYEFTAWKPERVIAFVVNKGGIYYTALTSKAARAVPGLLFTGGLDLGSRTDTIKGLFALNRRAGALWALTEEPKAGHVVGRSRELALLYFEDVLALRVAEPGSPLRAVQAGSGYLGDIRKRGLLPVRSATVTEADTAWLPTERVSRAWRSVVTDEPFNADLP